MSLDTLWAELTLDACASDGPIRDADVKNAVKYYRSRIEAEAFAAGVAAAQSVIDAARAVDGSWFTGEVQGWNGAHDFRVALDGLHEAIAAIDAIGAGEAP